MQALRAKLRTMLVGLEQAQNLGKAAALEAGPFSESMQLDLDWVVRKVNEALIQVADSLRDVPKD